MIVTAGDVIVGRGAAGELLLVLATAEGAGDGRSRGSGPASFATMSASETTPRTSSRSPMTGTPEMVLQKDRRDVLMVRGPSDRIPCHGSSIFLIDLLCPRIRLRGLRGIARDHRLLRPTTA